MQKFTAGLWITAARQVGMRKHDGIFIHVIIMARIFVIANSLDEQKFVYCFEDLKLINFLVVHQIILFFIFILLIVMFFANEEIQSIFIYSFKHKSSEGKNYLILNCCIFFNCELIRGNFLLFTFWNTWKDTSQ